jgi:ABC-type amino acid transport substrate-binding protein
MVEFPALYLSGKTRPILAFTTIFLFSQCCQLMMCQPSAGASGNQDLLTALNQALVELVSSGEHDMLLDKHGLLNPRLIYAPSKWTCPAFNGGVQMGYVPYVKLIPTGTVKLIPTGTLKLALDKGTLVVGLGQIELPWADMTSTTKESLSGYEDLPDDRVRGFDVDLMRAVALKISTYYKQQIRAKFRHVATCGENCDRESRVALLGFLALLIT